MSTSRLASLNQPLFCARCIAACTPHGEKSSRTDNLSCAEAGEAPMAVATILRRIRVERKILLQSQSPFWSISVGAAGLNPGELLLKAPPSLHRRPTALSGAAARPAHAVE